MLVVLFYRYLDAIERAVANGDCVLIENMGENMDPVLDPLVGRNTIKKGRCVSLWSMFLVSVIQYFNCRSPIPDNLYINVKKKNNMLLLQLATERFWSFIKLQAAFTISDLVCSLQLFSISQPNSIFAIITHHCLLPSNFLSFLKRWSTK